MSQAGEHARNGLASSVPCLNLSPTLLSYDLTHSCPLVNNPGTPGVLKGTGLPGLEVYSVCPLEARL